MRPARATSIALTLALCGGCGDGVAATTTADATGTSTGAAANTGVPTGSDDSGATTGAPTTGGSGGAGTSTTGEATDTDPITATSTGTSTGTTGPDDTGTSGPDTSTTGTSATGTSTTGTSTTGTSTGEPGSSTGGTSSESSSSESSSTGDTDTGGELEGLGYLGMSGNDSLVRFDPETASALLPAQSLLPHADYPYDMKIKPDGSEVWIVGAAGDGVKVVATATGEITQQIDLTGVGEYPVDVLFSVNGALAYVSARDSGVVVVLDAATYTVQTTIPLGPGVEGGKMAQDPCDGRIYMVDWYAKSLLVVDPGPKQVTSVLLGTSLWDLALDPASDRLYVLDRGQDRVHVVDTGSLQLQTSVVVGDDPWGVDLTADGGLLVVACEDDHTVRLIDTDTLTSATVMLPLDADPRDVAIHADDLRAYVPTGDVAGEDGVYELDLVAQAITTTISVPAPNSNANIVAVRPQPVACP